MLPRSLAVPAQAAVPCLAYELPQLVSSPSPFPRKHDTPGCPLGAIVSAINHANEGRVAPVVDGSFLPDLPSVLIEQGRFAAVDFIGGHCTNDGRTFVGGPPSAFVTDEDITNLVFSRWGNHVVSLVLLRGALARF